MFNRLTKPLGTALVKFLAPLSTIPSRFTTRTLLENLIPPRNPLTTNAFLGLEVFTRVGYILSNVGSEILVVYRSIARLRLDSSQ